MKTSVVDRTNLSGVVTRRLYNGEGYKRLCKAIQDNVSQQQIDRIERSAVKPQFKTNLLWKLLHKLWGLDVQIVFLTGIWTTKVLANNTVPTRGKQIVAEQLGGTTTSPVTAVALGIGAPTATALGSEIATGGGSRGAATVTNETTDVTGDTEQWVKSFTFTGSFAVTEEGLFDNNTSGGNMVASRNFSVVNVVSGDVFQITHKIKVA